MINFVFEQHVKNWVVAREKFLKYPNGPLVDLGISHKKAYLVVVDLCGPPWASPRTTRGSMGPWFRCGKGKVVPLGARAREPSPGRVMAMDISKIIYNSHK